MFGRKRKQLPDSPLDLVAPYDEAAQDAAWNMLHLKFDHTPDTIPPLVEIVKKLREELHQKTLSAKIGLGPNEADAEQWANLWGIYLGETLRAMFGGTWIIGHEEAPNLLALEFPDGTVTFPTAKVFRFLTEPETDGIAEYVDLIRQELEA